VLLLGSAAAFAAAGCSSDDSGTFNDDSGTDSSSPDSGLLDTGAGDSTSPHPDGSLIPDGNTPLDTGTPDTSTPDDTGTPDAGTPETSTPDSSAPETGTGDDGGNDAGVDSGSGDDAGNDSGSTGDDGGTDSGNGGDDGGADSGNTGDDGGNTTDAATSYTFTSPLQVDVSSIFNANSVVTTATGGVALTPMDGTGGGDNNDFPTTSKVMTLVDSGGSGLPDNGFFASNGTTVPNVQLAWNNGANVLNSVVASGTIGTAFTFNVPPAQYDQVQVYATGGNGGSTLMVTLHYTSGSDGTASLSVPDWCTGSTGAGEYKVVSVDRVQNGNTFSGGILCSIYAINLNPDATRSLASVTFSDSGSSSAYLVFYGATAW
jgi:hypothetical protein